MKLLERIFCKECAKSRIRRMLLQIKIAYMADTKTHEIFSGFLAFSLGLALLVPSDMFPAGDSFNILFVEGYTMSQQNWGVAFVLVGLSRLFGAVFGTLRCRKWTALISLYFWLLILFYLFKYGYFSIFVVFPFIWLAIASVFTFVSVWKRLNGTI
jgi:hypothetical protein